MPNFDLNSTYPAFVDVRRNNRIVGILNGTHTVANQLQVNGPNTGLNPVSGLEVGHIVDIVSPAGTVRGSTRTVSAISGTTTLTVTYSGADIGTDANGDYVILSEGANVLGTPAPYESIAALDTALVAANSAYWNAGSTSTAATRVQQASANDKQYALRLIQSPRSF